MEPEQLSFDDLEDEPEDDGSWAAWFAKLPRVPGEPPPDEEREAA
jgi:hypothetical protein